MGDRANVVVIGEEGELESNRAVFLYSHWGGSELPESLKTALDRGRDRWNDPQYFARIIFDDMVNCDRGLTGYGITTSLGDNSYPLLVVDCLRQVVVELPEDAYRERGLKSVLDYTGVPFAKYSGKWKRAEATA